MLCLLLVLVLVLLLLVVVVVLLLLLLLRLVVVLLLVLLLVVLLLLLLLLLLAPCERLSERECPRGVRDVREERRERAHEWRERVGQPLRVASLEGGELSLVAERCGEARQVDVGLEDDAIGWHEQPLQRVGRGAGRGRGLLGGGFHR